MSFRLFYILLIFAAVKCGEGIWAQEEGLASYYHHRFHGRKSSSGRVHDKEELVAAHRTYFFKSHELGEYEKYHCMRNGSWTSL